MCFIRKALDWVFTRHELKWLDDIMPESHKREKEEKRKKLIDEDNPEEVTRKLVSYYVLFPGGLAQISYCALFAARMCFE